LLNSAGLGASYGDSGNVVAGCAATRSGNSAATPAV